MLSIGSLFKEPKYIPKYLLTSFHLLSKLRWFFISFITAAQSTSEQFVKTKLIVVTKIKFQRSNSSHLRNCTFVQNNMTYLWHLTHVYWASNWSFSLRTGPIKNLHFRKNNKAIKYESLLIFCSTYLAYIHLNQLNKSKIAKFITILFF